MYGLMDENLERSCADTGRTDRYKVSGAWFWFKVVCVVGKPVLSPQGAAAKDGMDAAVRRDGTLTIESGKGWTASFDLQGVAVADAVLRVKAADAAMPENRSRHIRCRNCCERSSDGVGLTFR